MYFLCLILINILSFSGFIMCSMVAKLTLIHYVLKICLAVIYVVTLILLIIGDDDEDYREPDDDV